MTNQSSQFEADFEKYYQEVPYDVTLLKRPTFLAVPNAKILKKPILRYASILQTVRILNFLSLTCLIRVFEYIIQV